MDYSRAATALGNDVNQYWKMVARIGMLYLSTFRIGKENSW